VLDGTGYFQPGDHAGYLATARVLALAHQHIGPVYSRGLNPNKHLVRSGLWHWPLL
jgi:hypothetical protein